MASFDPHQEGAVIADSGFDPHTEGASIEGSEENNDSDKPSKPLTLKEAYQRMGLATNPDEFNRTATEGAAGGLQGYGNSLIGIANLLPKVNIPKMNFAPDTENSRRGEMAGDIASYFGPRAILNTAKIPHLISNALHDMPLSKAIMRNMGSGAEAALFGASHAPEGEKAMAGGKNALLGSGVDAINHLVSSKYPLLARVGTAGLGYLGGNMVGHPTEGAAIGALFPQLKGLVVGPSKTRMAENALSDIDQAEVQEALSANKALGTHGTPGQMSGSSYVQGQEGGLMRNAGREGEELERSHIEQQRKAANKMLNDIYTPTPKSEKAISDAYEKAEKLNLDQSAVDKAKQNPIIKDAFATVKSDPSFSDIPENNYKFLAEVDRQLYRDYKATKINKPNSAHAVKNVQKQFRDLLQKNNSDYESALELAAPKYARKNVEEKLNLHEEEFSGKNIYKKLLETPKKYSETLRILQPYPEARQAVVNMKKGWKEYSNMQKGSQAGYMSKTGLSHARNILNMVNDMLASNWGKKATEAQARYIHSPEWEKGWDLIKEAKTHREQVRKTLDLVTKTGLAYGLSNTEANNLKSMLESE